MAENFNGKEMKKHIPNLITGLNAASGMMAVFMALYSEMVWAAGLIVAGMVFDFFDGMAARLLHVKSEMGKELDSLADVISFGVAPALLAHLLIRDLLFPEGAGDIALLTIADWGILFIPLLIPVFSAFRLAKFNLDVRQATSFIGLPTPANALFWVTLVFGAVYIPELYERWFANIYVLGLSVLILSVLLVSELPMFSLKIAGWGWKENRTRFLYFICLIVLAILMKVAVIVLIIPLYVFFAAGEALMRFTSLNR